MVDDDSTASGALTPADQDVGATVATDGAEFCGVLSDYYRDEVNQSTRARDRIDQTTNWSITILVLFLSVVLSSRDVPAFLLLVGIVALAIFLAIEVRRYRRYDFHRARTRFVEENLYANVLNPVGVEHATWREELSDDLRYPAYKVSWWEALTRRVRRIYGFLFVVLGAAWVGKVTFFTPETSWIDAAALPGVSGTLVSGVLVAFYLCVVLLVVWPGDRAAMGEIYGEEPGDWKRR